MVTVSAYTGASRSTRHHGLVSHAVCVHDPASQVVRVDPSTARAAAPPRIVEDCVTALPRAMFSGRAVAVVSQPAPSSFSVVPLASAASGVTAALAAAAAACAFSRAVWLARVPKAGMLAARMEEV